MEIFIPRHSGFCPGVKKAEEKLFLEKNRTQDPIHILGHLIHNTSYINYLNQKGMNTIHDISEAEKKDTIVIRTHGIPIHLEKKIKEKHQILDLTCFTVKKLQNKLQEYSDNGYFIVLTGKSDHPEVEGLVSYTKAFHVIENEKDIKTFIDKAENIIDREMFKKILIASQTTGEEHLFNKTCEDLIFNLSKIFKIEILNSICPITSIREKEALILQKKVDITFVIGDKKSSNSKKIYEILKKHHEKTYFVEDLTALLNLKLDLKGFSKAQVVSSSSTPDFIQKEICNYLEGI